MSFFSDIFTSVLGANSAKKANKQALEAQQKAIDAANAQLTSQYNTTSANYQPYISTGTNALAALNDPTSSFQASPDYAYRFGEGQKAVTNNYATGGMLNSGAALSALQDRGQNTASAEYGNWWDRQSGLANLGQSSVNALAGYGQNYANSYGNNLIGKGNAEASYKTANGAINQGLWGTVQGGLNQIEQMGLSALTGGTSTLFKGLGQSGTSNALSGWGQRGTTYL